MSLEYLSVHLFDFLIPFIRVSEFPYKGLIRILFALCLSISFYGANENGIVFLISDPFVHGWYTEKQLTGVY